MTRLRWALPAFGLALALSAPARAQTRNDNRVWLSAEGEAELTQKLRLNVEQQLRLGAHRGYDKTHTDLGMGYRLSEPFRVAAHYRLAFQGSDGAKPGETRHRVAGDFEARHRFERIALSWRTRLQRTSRENAAALVAWRNRFKVAVDAPKRLEPFLSVELQYLFSPASEYRETRLSLGLDYRATKGLSMGIFYLYLKETNVQRPDQLNVLGIGVTYRFLSTVVPREPVNGTRRRGRSSPEQRLRRPARLGGRADRPTPLPLPRGARGQRGSFCRGIRQSGGADLRGTCRAADVPRRGRRRCAWTGRADARRDLGRSRP